MIKHSLKDDVLHISISNVDFSYRIPVKKMDHTIDWKIGSKETKGIVIMGVSSWALQLFTKKVTEDKYIKQFKSIVEEHCPESKINWEATMLAYNLQNKYNWLSSTNATATDKISEEEIISTLKNRFKLD